MNLKIKVVGYELSKTVPSFCEKYVTVLTGVEKRSEQTYEKLLKKKKDGIKFTKTNVSGFTNWISGPRFEMDPLFGNGISMVKSCEPNMS